MWRWKLHSLLLGLGEPPDLIKQQVSAFLHLFLNVVPFSINRTVWQHKSHLIWCVVFQSTSTETLGSRGSWEKGKSIASLMDRSWARNLQSPPRNHSLSLSVVPYCAQTHNEEHFGLFYTFMLVERRHYLNESSNLFYVRLQWQSVW